MATKMATGNAHSSKFPPHSCKGFGVRIVELQRVYKHWAFWEIIHESQDAEFCILMLPLFNSPHHRYTPGLDLGGNPSDALLVF